MFKIHSDCPKISADINNEFDTVKDFVENANTIALKAGILATIGTTGKVVPAKSTSTYVVGPMFADATGDLANVSAYASGKVAIAIGPMIAVTDQIETNVLTMDVGDPLYVSDNGKLTKTSGSRLMGYLMETSETSTELEVGTVKVQLV